MTRTTRLREALSDAATSTLRLGVRLPRGPLGRQLQSQALRTWIDRLDIEVVLDVGANVGQFAKRVRALGFTGTVISFEPDPGAFDQLSRAMGRDRGWLGIPCGLGATTGTAALHVSPVSVYNSFLASSVDLHGDGTVVEVPVRRLEDVLAEHADRVAGRRLFLKTDTQGFDLEVIEGCGPWLAHVALLQAELSVQPLYEGSVPYLEALRTYQGLGFELADLSVVARDDRSLLFELDCLMAATSAVGDRGPGEPLAD